MNEIKARQPIDRFVLWGRSMGAVTAILYSEMNLLQRQAHISCLLLDSPFSKLTTMVDDVGKAKMGLPSFIMSIGMSVIKGTIKSKINFDITKLDPLSSSKKLLIPASFISAKEDNLVLPKRIQEYFNSYRHPNKQIIHSEYEHNSDREEEVLEQCFSFIERVLLSETDKDIAGFGEADDAIPRGRKISEEDKYNRAKSRDLEYHLDGAEKDELAMFFNNMDFMRDEPPKALARTNLSIFDDDIEPTELDFEAKQKLVRLTGGDTGNTTVMGNYNPIQIHSIRSSQTQAIPNQPFDNSQAGKIRIIGRVQNQSTAMVTPYSSSGSSNQKIEASLASKDHTPSSGMNRSPQTYFVPLKEDSPTDSRKERSKSALPGQAGSGSRQPTATRITLTRRPPSRSRSPVRQSPRQSDMDISIVLSIYLARTNEQNTEKRKSSVSRPYCYSRERSLAEYCSWGSWIAWAAGGPRIYQFR